MPENKKQLLIKIDGFSLRAKQNGISRVVKMRLEHLARNPNVEIEIYNKFILPNDVKYKQVVNTTKDKNFDKIVVWTANHRLTRRFKTTIPVIATIHDLVWKTCPETMHPRTYLAEKLFFKHTIKRANIITCVSQATFSDLIRFYPEVEKKARIVRLGADAPIGNIKSDRTGDYALFVGTREPRKNLDRLIAAYDMLPKSTQAKCKLVIAGKFGWGSDPARATKTSACGANETANDNIEFFNAPSDFELQTLYKSCKFLVLTSLYEGFGLPIAEGLKYGKPALISNISSMPEVAGSAGLEVDPLDLDSIAKGLFRMIEDHKKLEELTGHAQKMAQHYSWPQTAQKMLTAFWDA